MTPFHADRFKTYTAEVLPIALELSDDQISPAIRARIQQLADNPGTISEFYAAANAISDTIRDSACAEGSSFVMQLFNLREFYRAPDAGVPVEGTHG